MKNLTPFRNVSASLLAFVLLGAFFTATLPAQAQDAVDDPNLIDKITLKNGKSYVGEIIEESADSISMRVTISGISAQKTFNKADVISIERDAVSRPDRSRGGGTLSNSSRRTNEGGLLEGRPDPNDPRPVVYRIPLRGLVGWDVSESVVKKLWEEAKEVNAKYVIFEFDCRRGFFALDEIRSVFKDIETEAAEEEIKLIAWVKEARGASVAFVLMFPEIVFHPDGWMGEGQSIDTFLKVRFKDKDVRAKMIAAWVGNLRGMAIDGGHNAELCEAMIRPELNLWVKMEGEEATFKTFLTKEEESDEFIDMVDSSRVTALRLNATQANKWGIAKGTASNLRALMNRLGVREYIHYEGKSTKMVEDWIELRDRGWTDYFDYRADLEMIADLPLEPEKIIGQSIRKWQQIVRMLKRCPPHAKAPYGFRLTEDEGDFYGLMPIEAAEEMILQLRQELKQLNEERNENRNRNRNRNRNGGGGGGG